MTKIGGPSRAPAEIWFAILLGVGSFVLFAWNIGSPAAPYFDETHYVPAARALLGLAIGAKWLAIPYALFLLVAWGWARWRDGDASKRCCSTRSCRAAPSWRS